MGHGARKQLAELLDDARRCGDFSTRIEMSAGALRIAVDGVGELPLPLRAPVAKKLIAQARQASFGRGEQTLSDTTVRDTWEIAPDRITLGGTDWDRTLDYVLDGVRTALGLPPTTVLRAEPHALLVYGKGQFFLPHQDSEKEDSMVGTLVVSLPSHHTGGELVVSHAGRSVVHQASREKLTFAAFYADCLHEVKPVKSGYRVALTMNLLAERIRPAGEDDGGPVADLARCLTEHFTEPAEERYAYGRQKAAPPNRLVYLLDHEYTQRGLDWDRLKGADATRTALLRQAAVEADCEAVLALAEVKETWDAHAPYDRYDYYGEVEHYDDCEDEECEGECLLDPDGEPGAERHRSGDFSDYELNELIDDEITLSWWTRPDGTGGEQINLPAAYAEVCATTENADLTPYRSEYEGYMGNYGNTLDRWYRRAAVVLWPRQRSFTARAEAGSEGALRELQGHLDAGHLDRARTLARDRRGTARHHKGGGPCPCRRCGCRGVLRQLPFRTFQTLRESFADNSDSVAISGHKMLGLPLAASVVLERAELVRDRPGGQYTGTRNRTLGTSRAGLVAAAMWYRLRTLGWDGLQAQVEQALAGAAYAAGRLTAAGVRVRWQVHSPIVAFTLPGPAADFAEVLSLWHLPAEVRPDGVLTHVITMPHVTRGAVDALVADLTAAVARTARLGTEGRRAKAGAVR
jgi:2-oxoglutarate-Fe(II)-dependent oxygenase superfamily protein